MNTVRRSYSYILKLIMLTAFAGAVASADPAIGSSRQSGSHSMETGYSVLRLLLEDEQRKVVDLLDRGL